MIKQYKIVLSNKNFYKEIEISNDMKTVRIGTNLDCDVRLRRDLFFENFELFFSFNSNWTVMCSENVYISVGDVKKLLTKSLQHKDAFDIKYQNSENILFNVEFVINFDYEEKKYDLLIDIRNKDVLHIGGKSLCDIYIEDIYTMNEYITIAKDEDYFSVYDNNTKYGLLVNGIRVDSKKKLTNNDFISFASFSICIKDGFIFCDSSKVKKLNDVNSKLVGIAKNNMVYPKFNRNTRLKAVIPNEQIEILEPPDEPVKPKESIVMQLLPAIIMLGVTIIFRVVMNNNMSSFIWVSVISMAIGVVTSIANIISRKSNYEKDVNNRIDTYYDYIEDKMRFVKECRKEEEKILNDSYYSLKQEQEMVEDFSEKLFDRNIEDKDFLEVRLGNGSKQAIRKIYYKKQEKFISNDILANKPEQLSKSFRNVENVPITLDLKSQNAVGIVGNRVCLYEFIKTITVDLITRQYYSDLKLFYIIEEEDEQSFEWLRLIPHVKNNSLNMKNIVYNTESKNTLYEFLYKEIQKREVENIIYPRIVVFVYKNNGLKTHSISKYLESATSLGITFIFFEEYKEMLPNRCNSLIKLDKNIGYLFETENKNNVLAFDYECISDMDMMNLVKKLAPIYCDEISKASSLKKNITLFSLLDILSVEDINLKKNWAQSEVYKSMAAPLGVKAGNEIVCLDLNEKYHGPHGLVAGTTGSGKSEILQSYILSMATLFHPYEVGFVIIDFKGGGMVNQFKNLPHLIGSITNIDGREINRSLLSIKAELRKRQEIFAEYDVNHIDAYIKLFKEGRASIPLPHLILIVDEFAELKMDQPEFMKELISAARIGRSLGVHLILATQKPSGVVDAQIWSNSKFKLCLKVQNKEDSKEVLKTPVAAEIKEPGRAYLQVGNNEIFELFQSAYSGAPANFDENDNDKSFSIYSLDLSGRRSCIYTKAKKKKDVASQTQLMAITEYINRYCKEQRIKKLPGICLPSLSELIYFEANGSYEEGDTTLTNDIIVNIGIYDDPNNQYQGQVEYNISAKNTIIIGSSQYGKTNMLQLMIRSMITTFSPSDVNVYVLDFASMALKVFDDLNHVGGVISQTDDEKLKNFMRMILKEMKKRKEKFASMGITSFASYKEAKNRDMPQIIIMLDNFIAFKELYPNYIDNFLNICREGISVGITVIITSPQTNGIGYKYMSNFANKICLYCNSKDEYSTLFDRCRMTPKNVAGRCLVELDKTIYEAQSYLAFEGLKEIDRVEKIKELIETYNSKYANKKAKRIPEVPKVLNKEYVEDNYNNSKDYVIPLGIDYNSVDFVEFDLCKIVTLAITGKKHFGKTCLVKYIIDYLYNNIFNFESKVYILDNYEKQFEDISSLGIVENYTVDISEFEIYLSQIDEILEQRIQKIKEEGVEILEEEPLITVIIQNNEVFSQTGMTKDAVNTFKKIIKNYKDMKILFIFADVENAQIAFGASDMLKTIKEVNTLIAMEDLSSLKIREIPLNMVRTYSKAIELGDAYIIKQNAINKIKVVDAS